MKYMLMVLGIFFTIPLFAQQSENIIIVTIDGVRWQEVFKGIDTSMVNDKKLSYIYPNYRGATALESANRLMPFIHGTIKKDGLLWGDTNQLPKATLENSYWFSYPGYSELFTGGVDASINSNDTIYNSRINFLEELARNKSMKDKIAVFGSWNRFRFILNDQRSGLLVNDGFSPMKGDLTPFQQELNQMQVEMPKFWKMDERLDYITFHHAFEYLKVKQPRILVIALGDSDEFAHSGKYDLYVNAIHQADRWIEELWKYLQSNDKYKNKTSLIITTDHGRGEIQSGEWKSHGSDIAGSNRIWMAILGPITQNIPKLKEVHLSHIAGWVKDYIKQ